MVGAVVACSSAHWGRGGAPFLAVVSGRNRGCEAGVQWLGCARSGRPTSTRGGRSGGAARLPVATDVGVPNLPPHRHKTWFVRQGQLVRSSGALVRGGAEAERWCRVMRSPASAGSGLRVTWVASLAAGIRRRGRVRPHVVHVFLQSWTKRFLIFKKECGLNYLKHKGFSKKNVTATYDQKHSAV